MRSAFQQTVVQAADIGRVGLANFEVDVRLPERFWQVQDWLLNPDLEQLPGALRFS
jgi:hypothetical protein